MCAALIWGVLTGDIQTSLSLAVFYELFWLDLFPAGTYMPPNPLFPMCCIFCLSGVLDNPGIATLFLPVMLTLPLAFLGSYIEKRHREWQATGYNRILRRFRTGSDLDGAASFSVWSSLLQLLLLNFTAFFCAASAIMLLAERFYNSHGSPLTFPQASWPLLWLFGAVGGVLALRIKRSYAVFIAGSAAVGVLSFFGVTL